MVFSGIDGITGVVLSPEHPDRHGRNPSPNTRDNKDVSELQDLYRRTLVASWKSPSREPNADTLIEDLFAGGSAWLKQARDNHSETAENHTEAITHPSLTRELSTKLSLYSGSSGHNLKLSPGSVSERRPRSSSSHHSRFLTGRDMDIMSFGGGGGGGHSRKQGSMEQKLMDNTGINEPVSVGRSSTGSRREVSEFDVREDLRSWETAPPTQYE